MVYLPTTQEFEWLIGLLRDLKFLERLEAGGKCSRALRRLRRGMAQEVISLRIHTLTVRCGEYKRRQALRLKHLIDAAGMDVTLIYVPNPGAREEKRRR